MMNGKHFLIYTTEVGGFFKTVLDRGAVRLITPEEFAAIRESGEFTYNAEPWSETAAMVTEKPVLICLAKIEDNHDFVLGASREGTPLLAAA